MNAALYVLVATLSVAANVYPGGSVGLYLCHRTLTWSRRTFPGVPFADPPAFYHWMREHLRWPSLAILLPVLGLNALYQHRAGVADQGWGRDEWILLAAELAAWLFVQRWHTNRDCTCGDDRHREKGRAHERVTEVGGRLVVAPAKS